MSGFVPYVFTAAQLVDIRRFCGYPAYGDGNVVQPAPWMMKFYLVLEYKLNHMAAAEGGVVVNYLSSLNTLESAIPAASATLNVDSAGPFKRNAYELRDRDRVFDSWRRRLCGFLGVPPGPEFGGSSGGMRLVV